MAVPRWAISEMSTWDRDAFVARLGFLFEGSPWIVADTWSSRPWRSVRDFHAALIATVAAAGEEQQVALIRAHPDLVGRAALTGTLTRESTAEQRAAGLDPGALAPQEIAAFQDLNAQYQARFGFPFVICARDHQKEDILAELGRRAHHARADEITTALHEIGRIAWWRLQDVVMDEEDAVDEPQPYTFEVSYGKQGVPVYRVHAQPLEVSPIPESPFTGRPNALLAASIDLEVFGDDFLPAYTHGDNSMIVATDSMKNFIIRESLSFEGATLEGLLHHLGTGFSTTYEQLHTLQVTGRQLPFAGGSVPDGAGGFAASNNLFEVAGGAVATASVSLRRDDENVRVTGHACGLTGLSLMKLTGSAFTAFVRDDYTTLPDRRDRPLFILMDVGWRYLDSADMLDLERGAYVPHEQLHDLLATTFAEFVSESIQHLLHEMGVRALARFPQLAEISFDAQNRTRDPYGARENADHIRVYSDPFPAYGRLTLAVRRQI
ncbi:MAG: urate oxidase [Chloroflexota bacterium]|nr:urate oxidase [Chloroflexota bacterium]